MQMMQREEPRAEARGGRGAGYSLLALSVIAVGAVMARGRADRAGADARAPDSGAPDSGAPDSVLPDASPETRSTPSARTRSTGGNDADRDREGKTKADDAAGAQAGRRAEGPREIPSAGWWAVLKRTWAEFNNDRLLLVAAGVTFYLLLALVPAIASFIALYGLFFNPTTVAEHVAALEGVLPGGAVEILSEQVTRIAETSGGALGFAFVGGLLVSLWSANAAMKAIFDALNIVYEEDESRSFIRLTLQSMAFTIGAMIALILLLAATAVVPALLAMVPLPAQTQTLISILRWPVMFVLVAAGLAVLFRYGPSRHRAQWRWIIPGSLLGSAGWLVFSLLFSWYVANFGSYNATYGSLGAVVGFMTWIWLSMVIVLVGAELNAETEHQTARDSTTGPPKPRGERGAAMADHLPGDNG